MAATKVSLLKDDGYRATIATRDHVYYADEPTEDGGTNTAVTPTEMLMGSLGACIAITLRLYAERKKWDFQGVEVNLDYERFAGKAYDGYDGDSRYVHEIREAITIHGDLDEKQRERMMEIATKCPVRRLIETPTFWVEELLEAEGA